MHSIYIQLQSAKLISASLYALRVSVCILYISSPQQNISKMKKHLSTGNLCGLS